MRKIPCRRIHPVLFALCAAILCAGCAGVPEKKYYVLNYEPEPLHERRSEAPYPYTIRVKEFSIEQVYAKPQLVYRKSPFQLQYYFYRTWAVKPTRMVTDIVQKHLNAVNLVSHVILRFDEGASRPDFELTGNIEAIEEYDSDEVWFAHLALRLTLTRLSDNRVMYSRHFDHRKQVHVHEPEYVVRELSRIMDFILTQAIHDMDVVLAGEHGIPAGGDGGTGRQDAIPAAFGEGIE